MSWLSEIDTQGSFLKTIRRDPHRAYLRGSWAGRAVSLSLPAVAELEGQFYVTGPDRRWMVSVATAGRQLTATPIKLRQPNSRPR